MASRFDNQRFKTMSTMAEWEAKKVVPFLLVLWGITGFGLWKAFTVYPELPDIVPSHFSFSGDVDSTLSKQYFTLIFVSIVLFSAILFTYQTHTTRTNPKIKDEKQREYWLGSGDPRWASSIERKKRSTAVTNIALHGLLLGSSVQGLVVYIFNKVFDLAVDLSKRGVDINEGSIGQTPLAIVGGFLVFILINQLLLASKLKVPSKSD